MPINQLNHTASQMIEAAECSVTRKLLSTGNYQAKCYDLRGMRTQGDSCRASCTRCCCYNLLRILCTAAAAVAAAAAALTWSLPCAEANPDAKRLYEDLLVTQQYNRLIRPVNNNSKTLVVHLGLKLSQLIDVDEKNQIMTTNVWLRQVWYDSKLTWNPSDYNGVSTLYIPSETVWLPDIVLYNNADGNYEVTLMTKASLQSSGRILWEPPAIYKSSCQIDVEFFPFDSQQCTMKFGSWTYDGLQVDLRHIQQSANSSSQTVEFGIDLEKFYESTEWDLLHVPAQRNEKTYPCCPEPYPDITFNIVLRRKTLFYTVNLIIPCVAISFLTVMVFYLPSDSGEKITLCISVLLALTVFFLLLAETIPPTSLVVPLIGKYLLFTMVLVTLSIVVTVVVLNVHFRGPTTHRMAPWVRRVFLETLPGLLMLGRPHRRVSLHDHPTAQSLNSHSMYVARHNQSSSSSSSCSSGKNKDNRRVQQPLQSYQKLQIARDLEALLEFTDASPGPAAVAAATAATAAGDHDCSKGIYSAEISCAITGVQFIARHLRRDDLETCVREDWQFVALVLDRLFLWIFSLACIVGTLGIVLQAPSLYDGSLPINLHNLSHRSEQAILNEI